MIKIYVDIPNDRLLMQIADSFDFVKELETIKSFEGRLYNRNKQMWIVPIKRTTIAILMKMKYRFDDYPTIMALFHESLPDNVIPFIPRGGGEKRHVR